MAKAPAEKQTSFVVDGVAGCTSRIELPYVPGSLLVLRGKNGSGKSFVQESLHAIDDKTRRKTLGPSDGRDKGVVTGPGSFKCTFGAVSRESGTLACKMLESDVDISAIVDPGFKDGNVRDKHRLRQLCQLSGAKLTADEWREALKDATSMVPLKTVDADDPVGTADVLREMIQEAARKAESQASENRGRAASVAEQVAAVQPVTVTPTEARGRYESAVLALQDARTRRETGLQSLRKADDAASKLRDLAATMPDIDRLNTQAAQVADDVKKSRESITKLEADLKDYRRDLSLEEGVLRETEAKIETAKRQAAQIATLQAAIESGTPGDIPTESVIAELETKRCDLAELVSQSNEWEKAKTLQADARKAAKAAEDMAATAAKLRAMSDAVDDGVQQAVAKAGLSGVVVRGGRLCVSTDRAKCESFDDLSRGQRVARVIGWIRDCRGEGTIAILDQEAWEGLDPDARAQVHRDVIAAKLMVVAAEADSGELRVETFDPDGDE